MRGHPNESYARKIILIELPAHQVPHLNGGLVFPTGLSRQSIGTEPLLLVDENFNATDRSFIDEKSFKTFSRTLGHPHVEDAHTKIIKRQVETWIFFR